MSTDRVTPEQLRRMVGGEVFADRRGRVRGQRAIVDYKAMLEEQMRLAGLPEPSREFRFAQLQGRQFRFDWCWGRRRIAVEYEGGTYGPKSRHTTVSGFREDCVKYSLAAELGWRVFRYTSDHVRSGAAIAQLQRVFAQR